MLNKCKDFFNYIIKLLLFFENIFDLKNNKFKKR